VERAIFPLRALGLYTDPETLAASFL